MMHCISCGGSSWLELPRLPQAMLSDGRTVTAPLARSACTQCGLTRHSEPLKYEDLQRIFAEEYGLYSHAPGAGLERERQHVYANWLIELLGRATVTSLFEAGCGNGSLLQELSRQRPEWRLSGLEPAPNAVAQAQAAGLDVRAGYVGEAALPDTADVVVAINTAEHVEDPVAFLRLLGNCLAPDGRLVIICPDGDNPSVELLIYDHVHSFSRRALYNIALRAGFQVLRQEASPEALGAFQALMLSRDATGSTGEPPVPVALIASQQRFLQSWRDLDEALLGRCPPEASIEAFGAGEAAGLLRIYAPRTWSRVHGMTLDGGEGEYAGLPVHDYAALQPDASRVLLLAVRPAVQAILTARLEADGHRTLRWDDLLSTNGGSA